MGLCGSPRRRGRYRGSAARSAPSFCRRRVPAGPGPSRVHGVSPGVPTRPRVFAAAPAPARYPPTRSVPGRAEPLGGRAGSTGSARGGRQGACSRRGTHPRGCGFRPAGKAEDPGGLGGEPERIGSGAVPGPARHGAGPGLRAALPGRGGGAGRGRAGGAAAGSARPPAPPVAPALSPRR